MDSFEFNKIAGAVLGTALFVLLVSFLAETLFHSEAPETPVYLAELAGSTGPAEGGKPEPVEEPIAMLMASADVGAGQNVFKKCTACHSVEDGKNGIGPSLWNIVDRPMASVDGYAYSSAMAEFADGGKVWDYEALNAFLIKPKSYINGTKMSFGGLSKGKDRGNVILYLRSLAGSPAPMPAAADSAVAPMEDKPVTEAAGESAAAEGATAESAPQADEDSSMGTDTAMAPSQDAVPAETAPATEMSEEPAGAGEQPAQADVEKPAETTMAAADPDSGTASDAAGVLAMIGEQDAADGEKVFRKCKACHTAEEGGKNKIGPALWNIVNRPVASVEAFSSKYSAAMKDFAAGGKEWTYAELDAYLANPKDHIPGNKMSFSGLKKEKDRAAILAYLRTLAAEPAPLP